MTTNFSYSFMGYSYLCFFSFFSMKLFYEKNMNKMLLLTVILLT